MKVRMRETKTCYPDGIHEKECLQGKKYDLPEDIAKSWIKQNFAVKVKTKKPKETKVEEPEKTKVIEPPETKEKK